MTFAADMDVEVSQPDNSSQEEPTSTEAVEATPVSESDVAGEDPKDGEVKADDPAASQDSDADQDSDEGLEELKNFAKSKGGAKKALESIHQTYKEMKNLRKEMNALKESKEAPAVVKALEEEFPDLGDLKQEIADYTDKLKATESKYSTAVTKRYEYEGELREAKGALKYVGDDLIEKQKLERIIDSLESKIEREGERANDAKDHYSDLKREVAARTRKLDNFTKQAENLRAQQRAEQESLKAGAQRYRDVLEETLDSYAEGMDSETEEAFRDIVFTKVKKIVDASETELDFAAVVKAQAETWVKKLGVKKAQEKQTQVREKLQASTKPSAAALSQVKLEQVIASQKEWTIEDARKWARLEHPAQKRASR